jgi:hypothetical protein
MSNRYWYLEYGVKRFAVQFRPCASGRARCEACTRAIAKGEPYVVIGTGNRVPGTRHTEARYHHECMMMMVNTPMKR